MSANVIMILLGWLIALAIFFGFIVLLRYIHYKERMALLAHGINPDNVPRQRRSRGMLRAGLITAMVGLTLTIGLYPVGFLLPAAFTAAPLHIGPWLLPGLIPFGVGIALIVSYYLEQNTQVIDENKENEKIIALKDRQGRERKGREL
ncbi:MAG TPA: DUF6249 domain-containing protein [Ktedonobacteraceae bacterium]|nr:DUF6249 domain-containing protein [Ktedonobacteraceae bacterium]